jgi:hypothetical protein
VKHAGPAALERLAGLLMQLRDRPALAEPRPGVFYRRSRAFLHFHEDPAGLFADFRPGDDWLRLPVTSQAEQAGLIEAIDRALAEGR